MAIVAQLVRAADCGSVGRGFEPRRSPSFSPLFHGIQMTQWEALILGMIQGITEFLPISSSGHLELVQALLGFQNLHQYVLFNLTCHLGTLAAILCVFSPQIRQGFTTNYQRLFQVIIGTLPLFPLVIILKPIKTLFDQPELLGFFFLITATFIYLSSKAKIRKRTLNQWRDPLVVGLFQAVAVLPGISRSGSTIAAAQLLGWKREEAVSFSFLLAIPAILGGMTLEIFQVLKQPYSDSFFHLPTFAIGFITSFGIGYFALKLLIRLMAQDKWIYFAWYCLAVGIFSLVYFNGIL